ncbi:hypothetical protein Pfo_030227 [Paulownia fortunei]|nr:hypothetical protein Pfo_030227 [Paulownia fortunei]
MATEADIPAPICETRREQGGNIDDQATSISINKLPQEEKTQADTPNGPPTVEGENFLRTPSIGEVHCEGTEKPDQTVKDETEILRLRNPKLDDQPLEIAANEETSSKRIQQNAEESNGSDKDEDRGVTTNDYTGDGKTTEEDISCNLTSASKEGEGDQNKMTSEWEGLGNERNFAENLDTAAEKAGQENSTVMETITHATSDSDEFQSKKDLNSSFCKEEDIPIQKGDRAVTTPEDSGILLENTVKDEDEDLSKAQLFENEKNTSTLLKEDAQTEKPVESLHVAPENIKATNLGQENKTSSPEERSTNANLHGITSDNTEEKTFDAVDTQMEVLVGSINAVLQGATSDSTDEKTIDEVDTQKEVLENFSTIVSNEEIEENSMIKLDGSETKNEELLEKESEKHLRHNLWQGKPARIEDGELMKAELCENEKSTESTLLEIESKIEKPECSLNVASEDIKASNLAHPQIILHGKTDDETLDAAETKEETLEEIEENSMIKMDGSKTKNEELIEKESEKTSLQQPLTREASDNESTVMHEARTEYGELRKAELCENEKCTESMLVEMEIESKIEKPECSLNAASEDIKASDLGQEIETSSFKEQSVTAHPQVILGGNTDDKTLDAAEIKEEILENVPTIVSNEKTEENSLIQVDGPQMKNEEHLEKDREKPSLIKDLTRNANDDELTVTDEVKIEDESPSRAELLKKRKNVATNVSNEDNDKNSLIQLDASQMKHDAHLEKEMEKPSLKEASTEETNDDESTIMHEIKIGNEYIRKVGLFDSEKNIDSTLLKKENLQDAPEDHKASASSEDIETTCSLEEQSLTENLQAIMSDKTNDATDTKEVVQSKNMHESKDTDEDLIKAELLENEKTTVSTSVKEEAQVEKPTDSLQAAPEDIKASDSSQDTIMSSTEEQIHTADPQEISSDKTEEKTFDAATATNIPDGDNEDNLLIEEDGSQKPSLKEVSTGKANDDESTVTHEAKFEDESSIKDDLFENEKNNEGTLVKEEVSIESLQVAAEDIKHLLCNEENSLIQVDCSQLEQNEHLEKEDENTSLTEAPTRDNTESSLVKEEAQVEKPIDSLQAATEDIKASEDTVTGSIEEQIPTADPQEISKDKTTDAAYTKEKTLEDIATSFSNWDNEDNSPIEVGGSQKPSLNEASMGNTNNDESTIIHEAKFANDLTKAHLFENEKNKECTSVKEEVSIESLQEADEDIKVSASGQDREISYLEEQGLTTNPQGIIGDHKEDKTSDATDLKEETPEDKNVATTIPHEDTEENSLIQVDCSQMEQKIHLEKASDNTFLTEAPTEDTTESTSKEEAQVEKSIDSSQVATEDIKASASSQDTETSFIKEQIRTADPQEISYNEDNSAIELYGSQQPSLKEVSMGNNNDVESTITHEAKFEDENLIKADLFEKEKYTEGTSVNEKVSIESFRVGAEGIKASASGQDRETSYLEEQGLTTNPQEIIFDHKEDKTSDATDLKEETPEDKNVATTIPHEDTEENLLIQVDCSQMEQKIHLEKASDNAFLTEAPTEGTTESTLKEEALVEKPIHSSQVATEDIKAFASRQDTETSFIEEQIPTADPQKISCDKTEEKTIDASDTEEETLEDIETNVPNGDNEDNSAIEAYGSQKPSLKEASTGNNNDVESTIMHEAKFEDENLIKTDLFENEKYTEGTLVNEKVSIESLQAGAEDIKASVSVQDREAISQEVQTLTTNPQEIIGKHKEEKTIEATDLKEETPEDRNIATIIPYEDAEENSLIQVDCSQMEQNEHLGKESDLREAPTGHTTESALLKDEAQVEKLIDSFQVATEDIKASSSGQDTETSSIEEKILTVDPQETSGDRTKEETIDATDTKEEFPEVQDIATTVPNADNEDNSPTEVDGSQKRSLKEASTGNVKDHELTIMHEAKFVDESSIKADLFENEKNTEGTSIKEEIFIESLQVAAEHITASASGQDRETSSLEEQSLTAHPQEIMGDNKEDKTIDPTDMREETSKDKVLKEIEDIDIRAKTIELNEEEVYLKDLQMTTEVNIAAHEEKGSNSIAVKLPSTKGPDVNKDMVESRRETQQEAENEEAQKQDEDLHVSALIQDSSMEKIEKDVQLCLASANDSEITQEMQKLEEASLPAPDENIIENTERKESEVVEDATKNKYIEHMEQDDTTKSFLDDQKPTKREQEETECRQEKVLLDETVEQIKESTSIRVANDFLPKSFTETSEVDHPTAERELTINREDLQTGKTATGDDEETKIDKDEEEEAYEQQISDFSSAAPNIIEARDQDVARLLSEAPEETVILNDIREANIFYKTTDTTESAEINNNKSVEDIHVNNRSTADLETKIDDEAPETVPRATEGRAVQSTIAWETSMLISQGERDEYEHAYIGSMIEEKSDSNEIEFASEESKSGYESKNQVLESIAQVQSCDIIPKAGETETEEENLEAAAEIKSEEVAAEEIFEPEETTYEKETMKVNISSEKEEDEDVVGYHLGSRKEEVITESHLEDEVSKVSEEADDKAVEEPEENLLANESIDRSLHQKERGKSVEEVTTILATEEAPGHDENIICEAPPAKTVHKTIEDTEGKQENANTITMQHQEEDNKSKHESHPLPEFTQGNESEKQDQKNEICSSDEVQAKDEENLMLSAGKSEEEAKKADTCSKPTEDEDRNIYVEAEKVDFSSHTEDTSEVSHNDGAQDIPEDNENSTIKNKYSKEKYPNKNTESQISTVSEDIDLIEQASKATRITVEMQETKAGSGSGAVPEATGVDSGQVEEVSDKCKGMAETSTSVEPTTISTSKIMLEYTVGTSLEAKDQLTKLHDLPQESDVGYSEVKMAQKDGPFDLQNVRDQSEGVQELNEGSVEVSNKENPVEADPNENIEARVSSEGQEAEAIQKAPVSETLKEEIEEQQPERTSEAVSKAKGVNCQDKKIIDDKNNDLKENSCRAVSAKISESNVHQSSMEDDKNQESQRQIDSLPISPSVKCSDIEIAEKDLPMHFAGLDGTDVTELEVTPLPSKDKHVVLEADQTEKMNPENSIGNKNISVIQHGDSAECSQGEHEILKPSKLEPEEAKCGHEERTSQETTKSRENSESKEIDTPSLSDLFQASVKETSQMVYHSAIEKEPTTHGEDLQAEKTDDTEHEDAKTDEEKDDEEESSEQRRSDLGSEAPVMVNMGDADVKVAHKKSHNILSGVGSKVKHSIAKVKKAITGKSSHPKPPSSQKTAVS